jgi:recombination associated protein RdgC
VFKNWKKVSVYSLSRDIDFTEIVDKSKGYKFAPCSSQSMASFGFVSPYGGDSEVMNLRGNGFILIEAKRETKILPAPVIKTELDKKIAKLEQDQGRKLKKTEKDSLKDEVLHTLLPRAFSKFAAIQAIYDGSTSRIYVNAGPRQAEDFLALIRKALGSLPVVLLTMENPIELTMTEWVRNGSAPQGFTMGDSAELKAILEDGGIARLKKQDLVCDEIATHLEAGKLVTKLALNWKDRVTLTLDDGLMLTGMKFADELVEQNDDIDREDMAQRMDADFILLSAELSCLTDDLINVLGGEAKR